AKVGCDLNQRSILLKRAPYTIGAAQGSPNQSTAPISVPIPRTPRGRGRHYPRMNCGPQFCDRHIVDHKFFLRCCLGLHGLSRYYAAQLTLHGDTHQPKNASTTALAGDFSSDGRTFRKREAGDEFILSGQVELLALASGGNANASGKHDQEPARLWGHAKN